MIESRLFRQAEPGSPMVIAVFSYRYDAHLVPGLIENIEPIVHGYAAWDDRQATGELSSEPQRRNRLVTQARKMGARWILAVDPDERFESGLARRLPALLQKGESVLWRFSLHEMFTPDSYRIDGVWGRRRRLRLFPVRAISQDLTVGLHGWWIADRTGFTLMDAQTNLYHLRMATPERRRLRRDLYATADPTRQFQPIGYDYLDDERGMVLEKIPAGRDFHPPFVEDHGLWSPDPGNLGQITPDPTESRLALVGAALAKTGHAQASHALEDLAASSVDDPDYLPMAAMLARNAGDLPRSRILASAVLGRAPDAALALYLRGKAAVALGDPAGLADLDRLRDLVGPCLLTRDLAADIARPTVDFSQAEALWRRWVPGAATCRDGAQIATSPLSVVVIGFCAPRELATAVASLRAQDPPCEIIVVNSGGGAVDRVLADHLDHIRLITTDVPLFVGAARNIGIDASRGKIVAFLAGDCQALPGWVAGRLHRHDLGAPFVSNPVIPQPGAGHVATVALRSRYLGRSPTTPIDSVSHFGRSQVRGALASAGYFPTGLRVSEDSVLNAQMDQLAPCVWAPDVLTTHRESSSLLRQLVDSFRRGATMSFLPPFRPRGNKPPSKGETWTRICKRHGLMRRGLDDDDQFWQRLTLGTLGIVLPITALKYLGVLSGFRRQAKAGRLMKRVRQGLASSSNPVPSATLLADLQKAVALDPQDPGKLVLLGTVMALQGQDPAPAYRAALALDPTKTDPLSRLLAPHLAREDWTAALTIAENAAEMAPLIADHWMTAAEIAARAGRKALAIAYAQRGLSLAVYQPEMHARVARLYRSLGDEPAAGQRDDIAGRLPAHIELHKGK